MSTQDSDKKNSKTSREIPDDGSLRIAAQIALILGAIGSVALMLLVGQRNQSIILMLLFAGWVLAPFAALAWADRSPKLQTARTTLLVLMLLLALVSLAAYARVAFGPPMPQPASLFLLVPAGSWLVIAIPLLLARRLSG